MRVKQKPSKAATLEGFAERSDTLLDLRPQPITANNSPATKIVNQPRAGLLSRSCPVCKRTFYCAWGWVILMPSRQEIDLCSTCARVLRYGTTAEVDALLSEIAQRFGAERRAAA